MGIADNLGLYDLAGHLIPGVLALAALAWAGAAVGVEAPPLAADEIVAGTLFLVLAYVVGQACHATADTRWFRDLTRVGPWGVESHESLFLRDDTKHLAPEFRARLKEEMDARLGLGPLPPATTPKPPRSEAKRLALLREHLASRKDVEAEREARKDDAKRREQRFRLCYAWVTQEGRPDRIQTFKAAAGFFKGAMPAALLVAFSAAVVLVARLVDAPFAWRALALPLLLILASVHVFVLAADQLRRFDERFVEAVYLAFYTLMKKAERDRKKEKKDDAEPG